MSRQVVLGALATVMTVAGCTTAGAPLRAQQMVNRMAAVLTVLSPLVDLLPVVGLPLEAVIIATRSFNTARDAAVAASASTIGVQTEHLDQFVDHTQRVITTITPVLVESGRVSVQQMRELSSAVAVLPALATVVYAPPAKTTPPVPAAQ